ncbi:MAG TPA: 2-oxo acid dehydrogenase subunit E2, partial [Alphaproteobacteria bacterium]
IIFNADQKGVAQIAVEMKALAERARAGKLKPEEYQGGGFSISNLGMYGMKHFTSIINPPSACILAVGAGEPRPVVRGGRIEAATLMSVTLTCDHRVVDGATGATWVQAFKGFIEKPATMLA